MAAKLGADPKVVKLKPRAAKGASAPKKVTTRLQPGSPISAKPAMGSRPKPDDEKKLREALQLQLVGLRSQHREVDDKLDALKNAAKELNAKKKVIRTAIENTGVPLEEFDRAYKDAGSSRVDLSRREKMRKLVREAFGVDAPEQEDMLSPELVRDANYWEAQGYQDGIAGKFATIPEGCPPEHHPAYLRGIDMATERNAKGLKKLKDVAEEKNAASVRNPPPRPPGKETEGAGEPEDEVESQEELNDLQEIAEHDRESGGVRMEGEPVGEIVDEDPLGVGAAPASDDDFEASEEELARQAGRGEGAAKLAEAEPASELMQ